MNQKVSLETPNKTIALVGPFSHGKSALVYYLTNGTKTQRSSKEKKRNITMEAGYGNCFIYRDPSKDPPFCYHSIGKKTDRFICPSGTVGELVHHISFVDLPGHNQLLPVLLKAIGAGIQGAIAVVSGANDLNETPQLTQHLNALRLQGIEDPIFCLNKLDLVSYEQALRKKEDLDDFCSKLGINNEITIPCSFTLSSIIDEKKSLRRDQNLILNYIMEKYPPENHLEEDDPLFVITRSFDVNSPKTPIDNMIGGIIGGTQVQGVLKVNDKVELRPGFISKDEKGQMKVEPIEITILSIHSENIPLDKITTNGLFALGTDIDPFYTKKNKLEGSILGLKGKMPPIYSKVDIVVTDEFDLKIKDLVTLQVKSTQTMCRITSIKGKKKKTISLNCQNPLCIFPNSTVSFWTSDTSDKKFITSGVFKTGFIVCK